jgi:hypothetical protein
MTYYSILKKKTVTFHLTQSLPIFVIRILLLFSLCLSRHALHLEASILVDHVVAKAFIYLLFS